MEFYKVALRHVQNVRKLHRLLFSSSIFCSFIQQTDMSANVRLCPFIKSSIYSLLSFMFPLNVKIYKHVSYGHSDIRGVENFSSILQVTSNYGV